MIIKNTSIWYYWSFKINKNTHFVEFSTSKLGKYILKIDNEIKVNTRSLLSSNFNYKFILENMLFRLEINNGEYDIYSESEG